jgi:hemolysin D
VAFSKWQNDIGTQLATARDDFNQTQQTLAKASRIKDMITLTAPQDAIVLDIGNASTGSVVDTNGTGGKPLFTLVPLDGSVEAELHISGSEIGFVKPNDKVQLKMDAFDFMRHGVAHGIITSISEGTFVDDEGTRTLPYFKARVRVVDGALHDVPTDFRLIPGMSLQGDVLVGRRSIISYIIGSALRTSSEAMREP